MKEKLWDKHPPRIGLPPKNDDKKTYRRLTPSDEGKPYYKDSQIVRCYKCDSWMFFQQDHCAWCFE